MNGVWTNNWRGIKNAWLLGAIKYGLSTINSTSGVVSDTSYLFTPDLYSPFGSFTWTPNGEAQRDRWIRVGTSGTTPTVNDITIATSSNIAVLNTVDASATYDVDNGTASRTIKVTLQNTGSSSVTLREWGIFTKVTLRSSIVSALVYRELLDTPITLAALETAVLTLTLNIALNDPI